MRNALSAVSLCVNSLAPAFHRSWSCLRGGLKCGGPVEVLRLCGVSDTGVEHWWNDTDGETF